MKLWQRLQLYLVYSLCVAALAAAFLIVIAPPLTEWSERHTPHVGTPVLPLAAGVTIEQTFVLEQEKLDLVAVWFDTTNPRQPSHGTVFIEVEVGKDRQKSELAMSSLPPSGIGLFALPAPLSAPLGTTARLRLGVAEEDTKAAVRYQIDATKYPVGEMRYRDVPRAGDIAFQLRYQRPALSHYFFHVVYALAIIAAALVIVYVIQPIQTITPAVFQRDGTYALLIGLAVAGVYASSLLTGGLWTGAGDFSKDAAYLSSSAQALQQKTWPIWSHRTCGGMALLGNPEGNTMSLGTLLALIMPSDRALLILLVTESFIGAVGTYVLARILHISRQGSALVAAVALLSAAYAYRIVEGLTPVGGAVAFTPWVLWGLVRAHRTGDRLGLLVSGLSLSLVLLRGDVHIIVGIIVVVVIWQVMRAIGDRSWQPLLALVVVGAVFFLVSSIKILPYLEQPHLIGHATLKPYVAMLAREGLLDDVFLKLHPRSLRIPVLHGKLPEAYGNFGAYVGLLPIILGSVGILTRHPYRWLLVSGLLVTFLLGEGTLFEVWLRHVPLLNGLLRIPTRLLSIGVLFLGLLAGIGLDRLGKIGVPRILLLMIAAFVALDLSRATTTILRDNVEWGSTNVLPTPTSPTLVVHKNYSEDQLYHATKLNRAGYLLPHICGDQNNPPAFIQELKEVSSLATVPASLAPNRIELAVKLGPADVIVRERFISSWMGTGGIPLEAPDGSIHVVVSEQKPGSVMLTYVDPLARAQQALTVALMIMVAIVIISLTKRAFQ